MVTEAIGRNLVNMYMEMVPRTRPIPEPVEPLLPPGYRFHPTDEELVSYYLANKVSDGRFNVSAISEVDLNKCEPWDLPDKAKMGEKEWYFYTLRDRKYPTGLRTNRATEAGYWKATGKDREVMNSRSSCLVGMKKTLVFYKGRAPKGEKTNWIMHEYRLEGDTPLLHLAKASKDEWVVCRIFRKNMGGKKNMPEGLRNLNPYNDIDGQSALPPLLESPHTGGVEEGAGGTDNEPASLQRDPLSFLNKQRPALKQSNDMESWVSRGRITPQYLELPIQYPSLTAMTKSSMALNSLRCYQGNKLFPADLSQELGAQASLLSAATAPTLTALAPSSMCMQANNVPASTLVLRALIEQYSNPGRQTCKIEPGVRDGTPKLSCKNPPPVTAWTTDSHQQFEPPISASQVQLPAVSHVVNQLAGGISCLADACGEEAQPNVFSRMAKFNTLEHAVNNEMESLWTY